MAIKKDDAYTDLPIDRRAEAGISVIQARDEYLLLSNQGKLLTVMTETEITQLYNQLDDHITMRSLAATNHAEYRPFLQARLESLDHTIAAAEVAYKDSADAADRKLHLHLLRAERQEIAGKLADATAGKRLI